MPPFPPRGLIIPLITPLDSRRGVDWEPLKRLLDRLLPFSDGLLIGEPLAGEGFLLSEKMRIDLFRAGVETVGGRKPLFLCPTAQTSEETLNLVAAGEKSFGGLPGCHSLFWVDLPLWHHSNRKLPNFYEEWGRRSLRPILLHNHPLLISSLNRSLKRKNIRTAVLKKLSQNEQLAGLIQAGDFQRTLHYQRAVRGRRDFRIYDGDEMSFLNQPSASGVLSWGANLLPAEWQEIVRGALTPSEDPASGLKLFQKSQKLKELCAAMGLNPAASLKYALHRLGMIPGAAIGGGGLLPASAEFPEMEAFLRKNFSLQVRGTNDIDKADFGSRKP
jgi:4-hydroxy-tetrahydrodipicolinate synthase